MRHVLLALTLLTTGLPAHADWSALQRARVTVFLKGETTAVDRGQRVGYSRSISVYLTGDRVYLFGLYADGGGVGRLGETICYDDTSTSLSDARNCIKVTRRGASMRIEATIDDVFQGCRTTTPGDRFRMVERTRYAVTVTAVAPKKAKQDSVEQLLANAFPKCTVSDVSGEVDWSGQFVEGARAYHGSFRPSQESSCTLIGGTPGEVDEITQSVREATGKIRKQSQSITC